MLLKCRVKGGGGEETLGRLFREQNLMEQQFQKLDFVGLFLDLQKIFAKLNKILNQCLDFSSLINDLPAVKAQKYPFQNFTNILSSSKSTKITCFYRRTSFKCQPVVAVFNSHNIRCLGRAREVREGTVNSISPGRTTT